MVLEYRKNRMERRTQEVQQMLSDRREELDQAVEKLPNDAARQDMEGKYFEMLLDYSVDEPQGEKVKYLVNGYFQVAKTAQPQEDVIRSFYDTLEQMTLLDMRVWKLYAFNSADHAYDIIEEYGIDTFLFDMILKKLIRLGVLESRNNLQRKENLEAVISYLEETEKGKRTRLKTRKISKREACQLSDYGLRIMEFIESGSGEGIE